jgi:hypothetical protein
MQDRARVTKLSGIVVSIVRFDVSSPGLGAMRYTGIRWQPNAKRFSTKGLRQTFSTNACRRPETGFRYFFRMAG